MIFTIIYIVFLLFLSVFSWSFVGNNFPFFEKNYLFDFVHRIRWLPGTLYCAVIVIFFLFYFIFLYKAKRRKFQSKYIWKMIFLTVVMLIFSFPAFSYDIFNYIATAKVTFLYRENPYVVMPIEIPNEPLLSFMNAANKTALYGPSWLLLTYIPLKLGLNNLLLTIYTFKGFMIFFYLALCFVIWKLSHKSVTALVFFALNPLVIIETLVSSHNDVVMMFFVLTSLYFFKRKQIGFSMVFYIFSIFIKFATVFLFPVYLYILYTEFYRKKVVTWEKIWFWSSVLMFMIFFLSPIREEIYSWYLIWPLSFVVLIQRQQLLRAITLGLSFGLLFRFAPFLFTLSWGGKTPLIKEIVTFIPPILFGIYYGVRKKI